MSSKHSLIDELMAQQPADHSLLQPFYCDQGIFEQDLQHAVFPFWLFAGHVARVRRPGDFFLFDVAGESIIITRGNDEKIHALANVCRHRGSRVCLTSEGTSNKFVCPYHAWTYDLNGELLHAGRMPEEFDPAQHGLQSFPVRDVEGLLFINLSADPVSLEEAANDAVEFLRPHGLTSAKIAVRQSWTVNANWKLVMENFRECYHCPPTHPEYCSVMGHGLDDQVAATDPESAIGRWYAADRARGCPAPQTNRDNPHRHLCGRFPIQDGFVTQSQDGKPVAPLMGSQTEYDGGVTTFSLYPLHFAVAVSDHAVLFRFTPIAVQETEVEITWLVDPQAEEGRDYEIDRITWMWRITTDQDKTIVDDNQCGVNSRFYQPGPYGDAEPDLKKFIRWYLDRLKPKA